MRYSLDVVFIRNMRLNYLLGKAHKINVFIFTNDYLLTINSFYRFWGSKV